MLKMRSSGSGSSAGLSATGSHRRPIACTARNIAKGVLREALEENHLQQVITILHGTINKEYKEPIKWFRLVSETSFYFRKV